MAEAELCRFIDRLTVEYVRTYPHPIERVWRAITEPTEFHQWFMPGSMELREGGTYEFGPDWTGQVLAIEPPRFIRLGAVTPEGAPFWFQYELTPVAGGARMRFVVHNEPGHIYRPRDPERGGDQPGGPDSPWRPGSLGGWHTSFDDLADVLDGAPRRPDRWREFMEIYREHIRTALPAAEPVQGD